MLLLDTHIWIWLINKDPDVKPWLTAIDQAAQADSLCVSAISVWEMGMLHSKGRIELKTDALTWVRKALAASGISLVAISPEIAIESTRLPGEYHGDPADRIIIATARIMSAAIATRDRKMIDYCTQGFAKLALLSPPA